ncbi:plasmid mobilization relaxosome protein MobC [Brevundimonas sp. GCM10030266]|uniref:plasmid mobilization relaxosome protein MobC n=1 Tax=Brevundimonas sp. GCM10030266 TaxID=3273386 RepID=UPI0036112D6B
MDRFTVRLPPDLAARFDAAAAREGGRSRLLRRLVEGAADPVGSGAGPGAGEAGHGLKSARLTLSLAEADLPALERAAAAAGLSRTRWCAALVRRALHDRPQWGPAEAVALVDIQRDLRRIGVNVNQMAVALNTGVAAGATPALQVARIEALADEIRAHLSGVRAAVAGNLSYWGIRS